MRGTSMLQWGHQCARNATTMGLPEGAIVISLPSNSDVPVSVGTEDPTALSVPPSGNAASVLPVTCTGATSTGFPFLALLALPPLESPPPDATTATTTAITSTSA